MTTAQSTKVADDDLSRHLEQVEGINIESNCQRQER